MRVYRTYLALFALAFGLESPFALAQNNAGETKMQIKEAADQKNKVDGDLDQEITNAKLRADSGSKSKWSMSATANYRGGSVARPFAAERPDLSGLPDNQVDTSIDGTLKVRFRPDKNSSLSAGVSMGLKTPFQGDVNAAENQLNIGDPLLGYNRTFAGFSAQNSWNVYGSAGTSDESKNIERLASFATDYTMMFKVDRLSFGATASVWWDVLSNDPGDDPRWRQKPDMEKVDKRVSWGSTLSPAVEYQITDKINLRALFAYFRWKHLYGDGEHYRLLRIKEYNSVGVGIAVIRDVYLYPNVQFLPRDAKLDNTNVGLSATINVF